MARGASNRRTAAGLDIHHGTHSRSCTGQRADEPRRDVAEPLSHQLAVRIMVRACKRVGD